MKKRSTAIALVAAVSLAVPSAATAAKPPKGLYQCYQYSAGVGYLYAGGFKLVSATKYKAVSGGGGKYKVKGKKVTFKTGPYKDFSGKTRKDKGNWVIDLTLKSDHNVTEACSHS
jgi:hypothetical protein